MYKIAFCGAHGTGKTTLVKILSQELNLYSIEGTIRGTWKSFGVSDFNNMPADVRAVFQNYMLLNQINREDTEGVNGFITDRSVLDILGYTLMSSDMSESQLEIFKTLIKERLKNYTHFIYTPVEFEAENEALRADVSSRNQYDSIINEYLENWFEKDKFLKVTGSVEERIQQIHNFIKAE